MYKLRVIRSAQPDRNLKEIKGFTVPDEIGMFFEGTYFNVFKSGTSIVFFSGCKIKVTQKEVEEYEFADCRA